MSKEVLVIAWCDNAIAHVDKEEALVERVVSIDNRKPVTIDLCKTCDDALFAPLLDVMEQGTKVPSKQKAKAAPSTDDEGQRTCPECGFVSKSRSALGQHLSHKHERGLSDYDWN
jgi:hypothetical protein